MWKNLELVFDAKDEETIISTGGIGNKIWNSLSIKNFYIDQSRKDVKTFPGSHSRPFINEIGVQIPIIRSTPRWNFQKTD